MKPEVQRRIEESLLLNEDYSVPSFLQNLNKWKSPKVIAKLDLNV